MILAISPKNVYASNRFLQEAVALNVGLEILDVEDLVKLDFNVNPDNYSVFYIRNPFLGNSAQYLPQIIELAKKFKNAGKKVVDEVIADGDLALGKGVDYKKLKTAGLPIPRTIQFLIHNSEFKLITRSSSSGYTASRASILFWSKMNQS